MQIAFVIPGDINLPTGGYRYNREIISNLRQDGLDINLVSHDGAYPFPSDEDLARAVSSIDEMAKADIAVVDGLLGGAVPDFMKKLSERMPVVALIHHPLCLENGINEKAAKALEESEGKGLAFVNGIITTSPATAKSVNALFSWPIEKISTVLPGVDRGKRSIGSTDSTIRLLCIGSVIERKGHDYLIRALATLRHLNWRLDCIGSTEFDKKLFGKLQTKVMAENLEDRIVFHGSVSEEALEEAYLSADVFVLPSLFEGYGMVYAEAIVRGLPVIGTTAGAIPQTVPDTCGILVEPANATDLAKALEDMISNPQVREEYRRGAIRAEPDFPNWQDSARQFADYLRKLT